MKFTFILGFFLLASTSNGCNKHKEKAHFEDHEKQQEKKTDDIKTPMTPRDNLGNQGPKD